MTAARDSQSVEARKARYSRELAAYTLRQWDLVRQSMEGGDNKDKSADSPSLIARQGKYRLQERTEAGSPWTR